MASSMPTRGDLIIKLQRLCSGQESRQDIAAWAVSIIDDDSMRVTDRLVWDVLKRLGAVDLPAPDREFLYTIADFKEWISDLF
jgi:hypothetical protein